MRFDTIPTLAAWKSASSSFLQSRNKPKLVRIDQLIEKYHRVLDMSRLNILMELRVAIIDWTADKIDRDAGTGRLGAMRGLEEIVVRKLYELDGWGRHRYLRVVCIGYEIRTGEYNERRVPWDAAQRDRTETRDINTRCTELQAAITTAYNRYEIYKGIRHIPADEDDKTLKIFMAPEFFFRGPYGAYRDIGNNAIIMSAMRVETGKQQYANWLFVLGTALFATENDSRDNVFLENYALVQKGGPKQNEHHDFVVAKEFPSHVDFKHPGGYDEWYAPATSQARVGGRVVNNIFPEGGRVGLDPDVVLDHPAPVLSELVGGSIFTMDGILFGLEVCRDHYLRRLAHSAENNRVLIQLIPSAGMDIEQNSLACVPDGIIFNVDGVTPHVHVQVRSQGPQPGCVMHAASGTGQVRIFEPLRIPWPGLARQDVAQRLQMSQGVLSGTAQIAPPPLPPRPRR